MTVRLAAVACVAWALGFGAAWASPGRGEMKQQWDFGIEMARRGAWKEALFRFRRSVELDPKNAQLRNNLAVAYESVGDYKAASREYGRALELDPKNERIRSNFDSFQTFYGDLLEPEGKPAGSEPPAQEPARPR